MDRLAAAERTRQHLLSLRKPGQGWRGQLSSSALSTATAVLALQWVDSTGSASLIARGLQWLRDQQWASGGWGDTDSSLPNISTTLLAWAAFGATQTADAVVERAEAWLRTELGSLDPSTLAAAILQKYGKDQTFSVPILMACALGNRLGPAPECWHHVPQLPAELAAIPRSLFAVAQLPVVSYALPALIAIGHVRHFHVKSGAGSWVRTATKGRVFRLLEKIQPASGGYLEATPLTSFVAMALGGMEEAAHPVAQAACKFLHDSVRPDGSWPIDTDLASWVTTLSVKALRAERVGESWARDARNWLLCQQYSTWHPFTNSAPGGWAWTDLTGGVPDADDTSGALLALSRLGHKSDATAAQAGVRWLLTLQNRDGGMPTFCRGWGTLPFDRSTAEITAHALEAWHAWEPVLPAPIKKRIAWATQRAWRYLEKSQQPDGSWVPLWFGQELAPATENKVYGTATVLRHLKKVVFQPAASPLLRSAVRFLVQEHRKPRWKWGVEEIAVTFTALQGFSEAEATCRELMEELLEKTDEGRQFPASPIGLYFAQLWYFEQLYPVVWSLEAFSAELG
jgi:squalene-hopene/tetraprenyl-beta-curcumene cyclase